MTNEGLDLLLCMLICSSRVWKEDVAWLSRLLPQLGLAVSWQSKGGNYIPCLKGNRGWLAFIRAATKKFSWLICIDNF